MAATDSASSLTAGQWPDVQVSRALLSVSDKTGIVEFARGLAELGDRDHLDRRDRPRA